MWPVPRQSSNTRLDTLTLLDPLCDVMLSPSPMEERFRVAASRRVVDRRIQSLAIASFASRGYPIKSLRLTMFRTALLSASRRVSAVAASQVRNEEYRERWRTRERSAERAATAVRSLEDASRDFIGGCLQAKLRQCFVVILLGYDSKGFVGEAS